MVEVPRICPGSRLSRSGAHSQTTAGIAAFERRAIKISYRIEDQAALRVASVIATAELMQRNELALG